MNKDETLALYAQGKDAWNAWAKDMLDRRAEMEKAGTWQVRPCESFEFTEGQNVETRVWFDAVRVDFKGHTFEEQANEEEASFAGFVFPGDADFSKATFSGDAHFECTTFSEYVKFRGVKFSGEARFEEATFRADAGFGLAMFDARADFSGAAFTRKVWFGGVRFKSDARFENETTFSGNAGFRARRSATIRALTRPYLRKRSISLRRIATARLR